MNLSLAERARHAYQTNEVRMDDPLGLVVKLYDGMLMFLRRGAELLDAGQRVPAAEPIRRATDIVGELQAVLNLEEGKDVARNLDRIYSYCRRRIMESHLQADAAGLHEVVGLLTPLRDAWSEAQRLQAATRQPAGAAR